MSREAEQVGWQLAEILHHCPALFGLDRSTWCLAGLRQVVPWMARLSLSGIWQIWQRLQLVYKRGRAHVHCPDLLYDQKLAALARAKELAQQIPDKVVFLYVDQPTANLPPVVANT